MNPNQRPALGRASAWRPRGRHLILFAVLSVVLAGPIQIHAAGGDSRGPTDCNVPSASYPDIASALAGSCSGAVLAAGEYVEDVLVDREFALRGPVSPRARIRGTLQIDTSEAVELDNVDVEANGGASGEIFSDGFESGNTSAWN